MFGPTHVLHQRSVKTLMKHHFKDLADLASKLSLHIPQEETDSLTHVETVVADTTPMTLPLYILCQGCVTVWKMKPGGAGATATTESSKSLNKVQSSSLKQLSK